MQEPQLTHPCARAGSAKRSVDAPPQAAPGASADFVAATDPRRLDAPAHDAEAEDVCRLLGGSEQITHIRRLISSVASRRCTVLITGETGTGKEMVASYLHQRSRRAAGAFIPIDCSALSETLFESQMFGHVKGAFTSAMRDSLGFIRAADGGTLFLDEIGELPLAMQAKLLRVIQERCVVPVGEAQAVPVDVRIVCATNRDLEAMVRAGTFREDLFFRLAVVTLSVPPLRLRGRDVLALAEHFLHAQAELYAEGARQLSPEAAAALLAYHWPGNVRELANAMEHAHVMATGPLIELADLPARVSGAGARQQAAAAVPELSLEAMERRAITEALSRTGGCKAAASRLLGINVQRLNRRIGKLGLGAAPAR